MTLSPDEMVYIDPNCAIGAFCPVGSLSDGRAVIMRFQETFDDVGDVPAYRAVSIDDNFITTGDGKADLGDVQMVYDLSGGKFDRYVLKSFDEVEQEQISHIEFVGGLERLKVNPAEMVYFNSETRVFCPATLMGAGHSLIIEVSDTGDLVPLVKVADGKIEILDGEGARGDVQMALDLAAGRTENYEITTYEALIDPQDTLNGPG